MSPNHKPEEIKEVMKDIIDETEFTKRMLKVYDDKNYNDPQLTKMFQTYERQVNRHAVTLVLNCVTKLFDILVDLCESILNQNTKLKGKTIRRVYCVCAKTYISDFVIYNAMSAPINDIFYQDITHEDWIVLLNFFSQHHFPNNKKVVKAYKNFYSYIAVGNAMLSKKQKEDHYITQYIK